LVDLLESEGYLVAAAADGTECIDLFDAGDYDLMLLDIMMPEKSGYDVCRHIRRTDREVPIILLTAKGEEIDKVVGLELGADDYVTKPFGIRELLARINAALRRSQVVKDCRSEEQESLPDKFQFGSVVVDRKRYSVGFGAKSTPLTARELSLLQYFAAHPDEVLSRDDILNAVWGIDYLGTTRTLDQHIAQLRKKIEPDSSNPSIILTVHGVGYRYNSAAANRS
jgi:DNA-binding response OmpR family regulator